MIDNFLNFIGIGVAYAEETGTGIKLIECGDGYDVSKACTIGHLFGLANNMAQFALTIILPLLFFIGLFIALFPILKDPNVPANIQQAKTNFYKLAIGTCLIAFSYMLVKLVLSSIGVDMAPLKNAISMFINSEFIITTYAAESWFKNPLDSVNVQNVVLGIVNSLVFILVIGIILGIVRGVFLLMLGQENPDYVKRGKKWIIYSLVVAAIVFGAEMIYNTIVLTATTITGTK